MIHEFFGTFGWLTIVMPDHVYHWWEAVLAAAVLASIAGANARSLSWHVIDALGILGLVVVTVILMELSLYVSWTHVGAATISGVQGRYFLEIMPFLILALPRCGGWINRVTQWRYSALSLETALTLPAVAIAIYDMFYLPNLIYSRFS